MAIIHPGLLAGQVVAVPAQAVLVEMLPRERVAQAQPQTAVRVRMAWPIARLVQQVPLTVGVVPGEKQMALPTELVEMVRLEKSS